MFEQVCSISIREKIEAGEKIPDIQKERMRLLSKAWAIRPMSYKQFSNLVSAKNSMYAALVKRSENSTENNYLRDNLQEARWFLKSLQSRNETLLKVASRIVEHQQGFLEYGEEAMKPLVLHDIAEAVEMHESTISRVTTQKYMHTPRGIFELKYFFSSHVSTSAGGECSSTAIRALIKKLVTAETPKNLSVTAVLLSYWMSKGSTLRDAPSQNTANR
jgi:RNA polymerase sigma-54 factor